MTRKVKCGVYNMAWEKWDDHIELGKQSEAAGHKVQFFTDLMVRYLFKEQGEQIFGKESLAPGSVGGIKSNGVIAVPHGPELMGVTDPLMVMPQVAEHTKDMELLLGAIDTVRHTPAVLAQQFLTLDHATKGRCIFALGGSEMKQLSPYGHSRIGSAKKLEEALIIIRKFFEADGAPVFFEGEYWSIKGGSMPIRSYGDKPPRLICAPGVSNELMGLYSDGMLTNTKRHPGEVEGMRRDVQKMRDAAKAAGRNPDDLLVAACAQVVLHDDPVELERLCNQRILKYVTMLTGKERGAYWKEFGFEHPLGDEFGYARKLRPEQADPVVLNAAIDKVPSAAVKRIGFHCGSVDQVAKELQLYIDAGIDYLGIVDYAPWADHNLGPVVADNFKRLIAKLQ